MRKDKHNNASAFDLPSPQQGDIDPLSVELSRLPLSGEELSRPPLSLAALNACPPTEFESSLNGLQDPDFSLAPDPRGHDFDFQISGDRLNADWFNLPQLSGAEFSDLMNSGSFIPSASNAEGGDLDQYLTPAIEPTPERVRLDKPSITAFIKSDFFSKHPLMQEKLAPHQLYAIKWLKETMDRFSKHAVLADGTGLGKTFSAMGLLSYLFFSTTQTESGVVKNTLILAPAKSVDQWESEIRKFISLTKFGMTVVLPKNTKKLKKSKAGADDSKLDQPKITLMSSESVSRLGKPFDEDSYDIVIADEFHAYSTAPKFFMNIKPLVGKYFLALTATPFRNHVEDEAIKWEKCGFNHLEKTTLRRTPEDVKESCEQLMIPNLTVKSVLLDLSKEQRNITQIIAHGIVKKELSDVGFFFNRHLLRRFAISLQSLPSEKLNKIREIVSMYKGIISKSTWMRIQMLIRPVVNNEVKIGACEDAAAPKEKNAAVLEGETCSICLSDLNLSAENSVANVSRSVATSAVDSDAPNSPVVATSCGHFFHEACLAQSPLFKKMVALFKDKRLLALKKKDRPQCFICRTPVSSLTSLADLRETLVKINPDELESFSMISPKIKFLLDYLADNQEESVLVASPYKETLRHLAGLFDTRKIRYVNLSEKGAKGVAKNIAAFQAGQARICMLTIDMGESLNLQKASSLFLLGPHCSVVKETQIIGRLWRMGSQHKQVTVYRLMSKGTVEEAIYEQNERKSIIIQQFYKGLAPAKELQEGIEYSRIDDSHIQASLVVLASPLQKVPAASKPDQCEKLTSPVKQSGRKKFKASTSDDASDDEWQTIEVLGSSGYQQTHGDRLRGVKSDRAANLPEGGSTVDSAVTIGTLVSSNPKPKLIPKPNNMVIDSQAKPTAAAKHQLRKTSEPRPPKKNSESFVVTGDKGSEGQDEARQAANHFPPKKRSHNSQHLPYARFDGSVATPPTMYQPESRKRAKLTGSRQQEVVSVNPGLVSADVAMLAAQGLFSSSSFHHPDESKRQLPAGRPHPA